MNRAEILDTAKKYVTQDRAAQHGDAEDNFKRIAALWNIYLDPEGTFITPEDVAAMMALLKIARLSGNPQHEDSWIDGCGYLACGGEIAAKRWGR